MNNHIKDLIDNRPITYVQLATLMICWLMNMLDGMDVLIISFTAPAISKEWGVNPQALGTVFSAGLLGMTIGALFLAPLADKIGRKPIIIVSALIMGACIFLTSYSQSISHLLFFRFLSGLGIGCMLASTAALAAEFAPNKTRDMWVSFIISGYPIGAVAAGLISAKIIPTYGWEHMYRIAGAASLLTIPLIIFFMSESLSYYLYRQPANALKKLNSILVKMNAAPLIELEPIQVSDSSLPVHKLLQAHNKKSTIQLWIGLFLAFAALYFLTSWIPKLAKDAGLSMELAIYAGTVFNVGAFFGIITQGYFSSKFGLKKTIGIFLVCTAVLMACFRFFIGSDILLLVLALLGFGIQGGFVGLYALAARLYPTDYRSTGVGWAMGAGRVGGIVGPLLGGVLIGWGLGISANFMIFAIPALISGLVTANISSDEVS